MRIGSIKEFLLQLILAVAVLIFANSAFASSPSAGYPVPHWHPLINALIAGELEPFLPINPSFDETAIYAGQTNDFYYTKDSLDQVNELLSPVSRSRFD